MKRINDKSNLDLLLLSSHQQLRSSSERMDYAAREKWFIYELVETMFLVMTTVVNFFIKTVQMLTRAHN